MISRRHASTIVPVFLALAFAPLLWRSTAADSDAIQDKADKTAGRTASTDTLGGPDRYLTYLTTDKYRVGKCNGAVLTFDTDFRQEPSRDDMAQIEIKTDVADWQVVETHTADLVEEAYTVDLTPYLDGAKEFQLRFYRNDDYGAWFFWSIDNVQVSGGGG